MLLACRWCRQPLRSAGAVGTLAEDGEVSVTLRLERDPSAVR